MKSVKYILIAVFFISVVFSAIPLSKLNSGNSITLTCMSSNPDSLKIREAAKIMHGRLQSFGITDFEMGLSIPTSQIVIDFKSNPSFGEISSLLIAPGRLGFYQTFNNKDIHSLLSRESSLESILSLPDSSSNSIDDDSPIVGICDNENKQKADELLEKFLERNNLQHELIFKWSKLKTDNKWTLYALKANSVLSNNEIMNSSISKEDNMESVNIYISFNEEGSKIWKEITGSNIGKNISIVIDNEVFFSPKIMSEITGGNCMITGSFNELDAKLISSIIQYQPLPLYFKIN